MEAESPPTKHPRLAKRDADEWRKVSGSINGYSVQTGVGQVAGGGSGGRKKNGCGGFTFMQMKELQQQSLIYKYMEAGIPVPLHLLFPIWKSITSLTSLTGYSTASLLCNYKNKMEAEPGRCRRTDGKKWRCTKDVVPDHKYCQKHLHRGRSSTNYPQPSSSSPSSSSTSAHRQGSSIDPKIKGRPLAPSPT